MLASLLGAVAAVSGAPGASAATSRLRVGAMVRLPHGARIGRALPARRQLRLTVTLQPRDPLALKAFAAAVSTPGTPQYGHYLSVGQFARRFGADAKRIASVRASLLAHGLAVGVPTANHLTLPVSGTTAQVERTFAVTEAMARIGNRSVFLNRQIPTLPAKIAPYVQGVLGLDNVAKPIPQDARPTKIRTAATRHGQLRVAHAITAGPQPCSEATQVAQGNNDNGLNGNPELGYTADEIAAAYGFNSYYPGDEGAGVTVGLLEAGPTQASDVSAYQACYGTSATVNYINVGAGVPAYGPSSDDGEEALDIEQIIGLAPRATVNVYQDSSNTALADLLTAMVSADQAKVLSSSYGTCEDYSGNAQIQSENTSLQEAAAQGQTFFISSGDSGSTHCYQADARAGKAQPNLALSVLDPAGQPFATGVGGTSMGSVSNNTWNVPDNGTYPGEYVWNDGTPNGYGSPSAATGGGASKVWPMPSYQSGASSSLDVISAASQKNAGCGGGFCREVPDVAADADYFNSGYAFYYDGGHSGGGWNLNGGTSAAAPLWAAFVALADASPTCRGLSLGFVNPSLYQIAAGSYNTNFHDITENVQFGESAYGDVSGNDTFGGENTDANPQGLFPVGAAYDMTTGLGTPVGNVLGNSLCSARAPVYSVSVTSPGNQSGTVGTPVSVAIHGADSGGQPLSYAASGLPAGLSMSAAGVITGTPTAAQTTTVTVSASDQFTNAGSTSFTWAVSNRSSPPPVNKVGKPKVKGAKVSGLGKRRPKLVFTVDAGANAPALKEVAITLPPGLSFAHKAKSLTKGISLKSGSKKLKFTPKVKGGVLSLGFKKTTRSASLTLAKPAITISKAEAAKIRKHKVKKLAFKLKTTNAAKKTITLTITLKKLS